ncbi:7899_t:CDS:1, partial [Racocetra persica]
LELDKNEDDYQSGQDDDNYNTKFRDPENASTKDATNDPIHKLFNRVFVNDSLTCISPIEKLYYLAKIYPDICHLYASSKIPN